MANEKILIVDDEEHIRELLKYNLEKNSYKCITAANGFEALKIAKDQRPRLVLLDLMLPEMDGYEVCKEIKKNNQISSTPIIILSAKNEVFDKILGLELGADDYITKPFSIAEVLVRVKAILRRTRLESVQRSYTFRNLTIDFEEHIVSKGDEKIELTLKEFKLFEMLIKNKGRLMTRELLLNEIWGFEFEGISRTVDVHIRHLRQKIEDDDKNPKFIETIRGKGYRFKNDE
ncbi:response regulator transcription factor [Clostridium algoriphilum]|uniref:response regulator transcription factor n=1 Tax=Clostridium algoriphilum TaxID=198347 RepID=UPI001CF2C1A5|nr:response regulator transcription factor [Clostridium algoriphilum]MCB2293565.1 response regulator transcription factor [Clostridium algoriphilum]